MEEKISSVEEVVTWEEVGCTNGGMGEKTSGCDKNSRPSWIMMFNWLRRRYKCTIERVNYKWCEEGKLSSSNQTCGNKIS